MSDGRCGAQISQVHEAVGGDVGWLDKFEDTCSLDAGHEGHHVFTSPDEEHVRFDEATQQLGSYRDTPAEGEPLLMRFGSVASE
jgi:hypothetical protein